MDLKKEVNKLLKMSYSSDSERDVVFEFARTVERSNHLGSIKSAYIGYSQVRRNSPAYNGYASDIIEGIYQTKLKESKRFTAP